MQLQAQPQPEEGDREISMELEGQPEVEGRERLTEMPSFRSISDSQEWLQLVLRGDAGQCVGDENSRDDGDDDDGSEDDFEFASVSRDSLDGFEPIAADELFSDGRIRPVYPVFGRTLGVGDDADATGEAEKPVGLPLRVGGIVVVDGEPPSMSSSSSSSSVESSVDELNGVPGKSYCVWAPRSTPPSPDLSKKSHSTGASAASSKRWRLRDLVAGRSHSDGKERFVFVAAPGSSAAEATEKKDKKKGEQPPAAAGEEKGKRAWRGGGKVVSEMDMSAAHRFFYMKGGMAAGDRRRSFLPYRKDLLGFFANMNVAGRSFHPL